VLSFEQFAHYEDANKGQFGLRAYRNNKLLTAVIIPTNAKKWFKVHISVFSLDKNEPLKGDVTFFLHDSYRPQKRTVKTSEGVAELEVDARGAYTIGARVAHDGTRLELDLMTIPGGSRRFYKS